MADQAGELEELLELEDPVGPGPLEHRMQEVTGGQHVGHGPVGGLVEQSKACRKRTELAVGNRVPHQPAGQRQRVHRRVAEGIPSGGDQGMVEEGAVESKVVAHQNGPPDELQERREHLADPGSLGDHGVADAGERRDEWGDPLVGADERLEGAEHLSAPKTGSRHFGE
jgi:hypothetical protein